MHILLLVTDNKPSSISRRGGGGGGGGDDHRNDFMINLHHSIGLGLDRPRNTWNGSAVERPTDCSMMPVTDLYLHFHCES